MFNTLIFIPLTILATSTFANSILIPKGTCIQTSILESRHNKVSLGIDSTQNQVLPGCSIKYQSNLKACQFFGNLNSNKIKIDTLICGNERKKIVGHGVIDNPKDVTVQIPIYIDKNVLIKVD